MVALSSVCVFCGSSSGDEPAFAEAARHLGATLADRGIQLVYGGGEVGLMGEVADACLAAGGRVVGIIPTGLFSKEIAHHGLTELVEVASMHERKALMYDRSDAFLALPGGLGTLEELAEVVTWTQLGLHAKPLALVDVAGFWQPLVAQLDHMAAVGLLKAQNRAIVRHAPTVEGALAALEVAEPAPAPKWIEAGER